VVSKDNQGGVDAKEIGTDSLASLKYCQHNIPSWGGVVKKNGSSKDRTKIKAPVGVIFN